MIILFCMLIIIGILLSKYTFQTKGQMGESQISNLLSQLPQDKYIVLNDIMVSGDYGTSQIDHIVVSIYGIFVIETKNYRGWITGNEYGEEWTENFKKSKFKFRNPLKQNYGHVKSLEKLLDLPIEKFIPIVAFPDSCNVKVSTSSPLVHFSYINNFILSYAQEIIPLNEIAGLANKISGFNIVSEEARAAHINHIQNKVAYNDYMIKSGRCPKCNGILVSRHGKYGNFLGCSNYPKCKFTKNF